MSELIERAESLLAGITRGYWKDMSDHPDHIIGAINCGEKHIALCNTFQSTDPQYRVTPEKTRANAAFIAASPELVRGLCDEVKRLRELVSTISARECALAERASELLRKVDSAEARADQLEQERDRLAEKLAEFHRENPHLWDSAGYRNKQDWLEWVAQEGE